MFQSGSNLPLAIPRAVLLSWLKSRKKRRCFSVHFYFWKWLRHHIYFHFIFILLFFFPSKTTQQNPWTMSQCISNDWVMTGCCFFLFFLSCLSWKCASFLPPLQISALSEFGVMGQQSETGPGGEPGLHQMHTRRCSRKTGRNRKALLGSVTVYHQKKLT